MMIKIYLDYALPLLAVLQLTSCDSSDSDAPITEPVPNVTPALNLMPAKSVQFEDNDTDAGHIGGTVSIDRADDESAISNYNVVWSDANGQRLHDTILISIEKSALPEEEKTISRDIIENTHIPVGAAGLLVLTSNDKESMESGVWAVLDDVVMEKIIPEPQQIIFRDINGEPGFIEGQVTVKRGRNDEVLDGYRVFWSNEGKALKELGELTRSAIDTRKMETAILAINIPRSAIPDSANGLLVTGFNDTTTVVSGPSTHIIDMTGNALGTGPGGNEKIGVYEYGEDLPAYPISKIIEGERSKCIFDNGFVMIIDMNNATDDLGLPAYNYDCTDSNRNTEKMVNTAPSTLNDAMFQSNATHNMFVDYLGVSPLVDEKLRVRVHYGNSVDRASWDGSYVNLGDGSIYFYPLATLDTIAHEAAHGFTDRFSNLAYEGQSGAVDEAFADIVGETAEYYVATEYDWGAKEPAINIDWVHNFNAYMDEGIALRYLYNPLIRAKTLTSINDYEEGMNFHSAGAVHSYPFYVLVNPFNEFTQSLSWAVPSAFRAFAFANMHCWTKNISLVDAAQCVVNQAELLVGDFDPICVMKPADPLCEHTRLLIASDIRKAFANVDMRLEDENAVQSYFEHASSFLTVNFNALSVSKTSNVLDYAWDFGDGNTANGAEVTHAYAERGTYYAQLTTSTPDGHSDTFSRRVYVTNRYCNVSSAANSDQWIEDVAINGIQLLGTGNSRYTYHEDITFMLKSGENANTISLTPGSTDPNTTVSWRVWVDLNKDGDFEDEDEIIFQSESKVTINAEFTRPGNFSTNEVTRMRIAASGDGYPDSCNTIAFGEPEDFNVSKDIDTAPFDVTFHASVDNLYATFINTSITPPGVKWEWQFGDGNSTIGEQNSSHVYAKADNYTVTLIMKDDDDNELDSFTVEIETSEPPPLAHSDITSLNSEEDQIKQVEFNGQSFSGPDLYVAAVWS